MRYGKHAVAAAFFSALLAGTAGAQDNADAGHLIVKANCAPCHSVEVTGDSPEPNAPPMRTFKAKWPLESLEEALAEGIVVGHEGVDMPEFVFEPKQITDILAYLDQIGDE